MTHSHSSLTPMRILAGVLIVASLLCAATAAAAAEPPQGDALAPGWQARARPLFDEGPRFQTTGNSWRVPADLPPGRYAVIERRGDVARVIPGRSFEASAGGFKEIHLMLPIGYVDPQAIPVADLPAALKP